jgi:hypothetical protein
LDHARRAGCARTNLGRQTATEIDDRLVCTADREVQEPFGVEERPARFPELADHGAYRDLRRARAVGVAAHAVHDSEERRSIADRDGDPILVFFAIPEEAQIRVLDLQVSLRHAGFSCRLLSRL